MGVPDALLREPLAALSAARQARDERIASATAPRIEVPPVAIPAESFAGADAPAAAAKAQAAIRAVAARTGVLIERLDTDGAKGSDAPLRTDLLASGSEKAVLRFAAELQGMTPLLAFAAWDLSSRSDAPGALRLDAQMLSPWHEPR